MVVTRKQTKKEKKQGVAMDGSGDIHTFTAPVEDGSEDQFVTLKYSHTTSVWPTPPWYTQWCTRVTLFDCCA